MGLNSFPTRTPGVRQDNVEVQRALDLLKSPVDALLALANAVFAGNASSPTATLSGLTLTGALTGTSAKFSSTVTGTTITATTSMVSPVGFKSVVGPWLYEHDFQAWSANTTIGLGWTYSTGTFATFTGQTLMPFAGSVVGIGALISCNGAAITPTVILQKNGATLDNSLTGAVPNAASFTPLQTTFAKGNKTFAAGDILAVSLFLGSSAFSALVAAQIVLIVEMAA